MPPTRSSLTPSRVGLDTPLQFIKGVGPQRAALLAKKGLATVGDALFHVPARHEDRTRLRSLGSLAPGDVATVAVSVWGVSPPPPGRSRAPLRAVVRDASAQMTANWFGQRYLARTLKRGMSLLLYGKAELYQGKVQLKVDDFEILEGDVGDERLHTGRLVPIYSTTEGLNQRPLRRLMWNIVEAHAHDVAEMLPDALRARRRLPPLNDALRHAHFPSSEEARAAAYRRLAYDEFLLLQAGLAILRARVTRARGIAMQPPGAFVRRLREALPFALTRAQERVWDDIRRDMAAPHPMHRLLQGDVGSGKTVVAALAVATAVEAGYQAAVMAPTEILAEQHYGTFRRLLAPLGLEVALMTSALKARKRASLRDELAAGRIACVIGTHALVEQGVEFHKLGLAVVDEQHRFGVNQRLRLREKAERPDLLVMTATPIPRTLALTLYGDLDVSVLDELPPGRQPVITVARTDVKRPEIYDFLRNQIADGRQIYVVYPLVEESEAVDLKAATDMARQLQAGAFRDVTVGLLHGRMSSDEKDAVMQRFKTGEIHLLVSTTVIEVGIDVPNASVMLIEHAERFGLSQLHQLRGRVGRGPWKSYCILMQSARPGEDARKRITAMTATNDGFRIAEADLELRGPGEFFGTRQSGLPEFRAADLIRDAVILDEARRDAAAIIAADAELRAPEHRELRRQLLARWRGKLDLASVG